MEKANVEDTETVLVTTSVGSGTVDSSTLVTGGSTTGTVVMTLITTPQMFLTRASGSVFVLERLPATMERGSAGITLTVFQDTDVVTGIVKNFTPEHVGGLIAARNYLCMRLYKHL